MSNSKTVGRMGSAAALAATMGVALWAPAALAADAPDPGAAVAQGSPILDVRARYEFVDQANLAKDANAFTVRTRFGWKTASWKGLSALAEFENVQAIGGQAFNTTLNGKTAYPVVADPNVTELNRLQLAWSPSPHLTATIGRQRIVLDDQRFIGAVAWRQDDQTFDAARADASFGRFKATYAYLHRINRVFGDQADWASDSHVADAAYAFGAPLTVRGFLYALDFTPAPASSTLTYGAGASGSLKAAPFVIGYAASYAHQTDYGNNPGRFGLDYWMAEASVGADIFTLKANYERLQGDGTRGFSTPLATLHAFQGWADVFLTTPVNGIDDANLSLTARPKLALGPLRGLALTGVYHDFTAERGGADLGREWDLQASAKVASRLTALVKYADYAGPAAGPPSRRKVWVSLEFQP